MLSLLLGSRIAEQILLYLASYGEGYARGIARNFKLSLGQVQRQLDRLERSGLLASRQLGRTRLFAWNPRFPLQKEFRTIAEKALSYLPDQEREEFYTGRTRPRRSGKP